MWDDIKWQILNAEEIEVVPEHRSLAWRELIINVANNIPLDNTFRTMMNKTDFKNFDYNIPIVYNLKTKTLIVYNENLHAALNKSNDYNVQTITVNLIGFLLAFICVVLLTVSVAFFTFNNVVERKIK
ncbi:pif6 [Oxyplax ochracea nucleopolyhedrovirus]|uniref:Pif6 n=1 Tax=Oxyplax ochracea nucleopolyhedrovirus TaxID=2083176 RepID=A0A2L0WU38_9ABAC|nr:pif6 [Oxyplax ochracea nucleopolyhedrovirus]AVA31168.1 pif6 [Oxyplax ochracea nucleopolyhedrovirus]